MVYLTVSIPPRSILPHFFPFHTVWDFFSERFSLSLFVCMIMGYFTVLLARKRDFGLERADFHASFVLYQTPRIRL